MTRLIRPVRCVPAIVAAYRTRTNGGQVRKLTTRERTTRLAQVCTGFRLACSSSVTGWASTSSGGAIMISIRCWIMWSQNRTSSYAPMPLSVASTTTASPPRNRPVRHHGQGRAG